MDLDYTRNQLNSVSAKMAGKDVNQLIKDIAVKIKDFREIDLDDQSLLGAILGSFSHQSYCDDRKLEKPLPNGLTNNPRIKELDQELDRIFVKDVLLGKTPTSDTLYIEDGKVFMDIANTPFTKLSPYWQHDNYMAGKCAARSVITNWEGITNPEPQVRKYVTIAVANAIHESWIARGNVGKRNKELETAYINLSDEEKLKDLKHYRMAVQMMTSLIKAMGLESPENI